MSSCVPTLQEPSLSKLRLKLRLCTVGSQWVELVLTVVRESWQWRRVPGLVLCVEGGDVPVPCTSQCGTCPRAFCSFLSSASTVKRGSLVFLAYVWVRNHGLYLLLVSEVSLSVSFLFLGRPTLQCQFSGLGKLNGCSVMFCNLWSVLDCMSYLPCFVLAVSMDCLMVRRAQYRLR